MPQSFVVLRCYSCFTFQVQQVRKTNKWMCKLCGERQSTKKVFAEGSGAECRHRVQELNMARGEKDNLVSVDTAETLSSVKKFLVPETFLCQREVSQEKSSKWLEFVDHDSTSEDECSTESVNEEHYTTDHQTFAQAKKRRRGQLDKRTRAFKAIQPSSINSQDVEGLGPGPYQSLVNRSSQPAGCQRLPHAAFKLENESRGVHTDVADHLSHKSKWSKFMAQDSLSDNDEDKSQQTVPVSPVKQSEGSATALSSIICADSWQTSALAYVPVSLSPSSLFVVDDELEDASEITL